MQASRYRVMKFGGSSVGQPERLERVLQIIAAERQKGPIAVVVSAMSDTTDWLIEAADLAYRGEPEAAAQMVKRVADLAIDNGQRMLAAAGYGENQRLRRSVQEGGLRKSGHHTSGSIRARPLTILQRSDHFPAGKT